MVNVLLAFKYIQTHSAVEIKRIVENAIEFYELTEHDSSATTDGGEDFKSACMLENEHEQHYFKMVFIISYEVGIEDIGFSTFHYLQDHLVAKYKNITYKR